jgi:hypothetical protein
MQRTERHRRGILGTAGAVFLATLLTPLTSSALDAPSGKVILLISGKLTQPNAGDTASFDLALLQSLPQSSFSTTTPWYPQPRKFTGVLLRDLFEAIGAQDASAKAIALNDYSVDIPNEDVARHGAMLAYLLDDKPMTVREKGPLVIIYPFSDKPQLRTAVHYSRAIWQLKSLELR